MNIFPLNNTSHPPPPPFEVTTSLEYINECGNIQKELYISLIHTFEHCKKPKPKIGKNVPRRGIAQPQSQFPHSCFCERFIYPYDRSIYSVAGNMWTNPGNI